jgi:peptidoglycan/LPS O-acetylase OafA/YrhL
MLAILTGCITAILVFKFPGKLAVKFKYATLIQAGLCMAAWFFNWYNWPAGINNIPLSISIAVLLLSVINNRGNIIFKILNYKPVAYIGTISYSLYIWQQIFTFKQPWANTAFPGTSVFVNLLLLLITAIVSYHLYEKQFLKLKRRLNKVKNEAGKKVNYSFSNQEV